MTAVRVARVTPIATPYKQKPLSLAREVRHVHRMEGWRGLAAVIAAKLAERA
ncbi:MAG TPA: hypothetical protein VFJ96_10205 [Gemmatimonadaceae bacterium]|nr:hypothetical protein [Gemmatimonadaceae bacterium]